MKRLHRGTSQSMQGVSVLGCDVGAEVTPWVQVWGTCLGHQLLQILAANTSYNELLVQTDAVVTPLCLSTPLIFIFIFLQPINSSEQGSAYPSCSDEDLIHWAVVCRWVH